MNSELLIILLIAHVLGDFYFQPQALSDKKKDSYSHVMLHSLIYAAPILLLFMFKLNWAVLWVGLIYIFAHYAIDTLKYWIETAKNTVWVFVFDQVLHGLSLFILSAIFKTLVVYPTLISLLGSLGITFSILIKAILLMLIVLKPANITYKSIFSNFKPVSGEESELKTGAVIGNLERLLVLFLLIAGQYTAIGLVIAGKSIARYKKIAEEKDFAEYYLIGTFYSILAVLVPFLILW